MDFIPLELRTQIPLRYSGLEIAVYGGFKPFFYRCLLLEQRTALPLEGLYLRQQILDRYVKVSGKTVYTKKLSQFSAVELLI